MLVAKKPNVLNHDGASPQEALRTVVGKERNHLTGRSAQVLSERMKAVAEQPHFA